METYFFVNGARVCYVDASSWDEAAEFFYQHAGFSSLDSAKEWIATNKGFSSASEAEQADPFFYLQHIHKKRNFIDEVKQESTNQ